MLVHIGIGFKSRMKNTASKKKTCLGFLLIVFLASLGQHHLALCGELLPGADGGECGFRIAVRLTYGTEQPCGNQPQDVPLPGREGGKVCVCHAFRGQQRMMVGDLAAVDDLLHMDGNRLFHSKRLARIRHQPRQGCRHIIGQETTVRSGIGDEPFFVKT